MAKATFKLNKKGCADILNSAGVQAVLGKSGNGMLGFCEKEHVTKGAKYTADVRKGKNRAHGMLKADNYAARVDQSCHDTMTKAISSGKV